MLCDNVMDYCAPSKVRINYYTYKQLKGWYFLIQPQFYCLKVIVVQQGFTVCKSTIRDKMCKDETDLDILNQKQSNTP